MAACLTREILVGDPVTVVAERASGDVVMLPEGWPRTAARLLRELSKARRKAASAGRKLASGHCGYADG